MQDEMQVLDQLRLATYMEGTYQGDTRRGWEGDERIKGWASRVQENQGGHLVDFLLYEVDW